MTNNNFRELFKSRISDLIDDKRDLDNVTLKDQAECLDINFGTLAKYKRGEMLPTAEVIYKMAKYYNVPSDYLLGLSDSRSLDLDERKIADKLHINDEALYYLLHPFVYTPFWEQIPLIESHLTIEVLLEDHDTLATISKYLQSGLTGEEEREYKQLEDLYKPWCTRMQKNKEPDEIRHFELKTKRTHQYETFHELINNLDRLRYVYRERIENKYGKSEKN